MGRYKYIKIHISFISDEIIKEYNLMEIVDDDGYVWVEIRKGMYDLPQVGILANKLLEKHLATAKYVPTPHTPGLWRHVWWPMMFTLVVDDFNIKYVGWKHAQHLLDTLQLYYKISTDWEGRLYCGISLKWNYAARTVDISMPGYIQKVLEKLQHPPPDIPEYTPHKAKSIQYGSKIQMAKMEDTIPRLAKEGITRIQQIIGALLFYLQAVHYTMLVALSSILLEQAKETKESTEATVQLLNYAATHPDAIIRYHASNMILHNHSDGSYLSKTKGRTIVGGHFYLGVYQ